jgi:hypothetical protein
MSTESIPVAIDACRRGIAEARMNSEDILALQDSMIYSDRTYLRDWVSGTRGWAIHWNRVMEQHRAAGWDVTEEHQAVWDFHQATESVVGLIEHYLGMTVPAGVDPQPEVLKVNLPGQMSREKRALIRTIILGYVVIIPPWIIADYLMDAATEKGLMTFGLLCFVGWSFGALIMTGQWSAEQKNPSLAKYRHAANAAFGAHVAVKAVEYVHGVNERLNTPPSDRPSL